MKNYIQSPLPFQGQKRGFIKLFREGLKDYDQYTTFVDLFGGSGLLAHAVKQQRPDARVIYNDYDNFSKRLSNVDETNALIGDLRGLIGKYEPNSRIVEPLKSKILNRVKEEENKGFVDYITLSGSLLFSGKYCTCWDDFAKETFYNRIKQKDYTIDGYLEGVEITHYDYRVLFDMYKRLPNVCFLLDPPYLSTDCSSYKSYWKLADYLDVLKTLKGTSYFYFTSSKSSIVELCDWLELNLESPNPFNGAVRKEVTNYVNSQAKYRDIMIYKL